MYTPVACYIRVPAEGKRAEQVSTSDVTEIYHWTATIRNLRTFNITELDVDQDCFTLMDDELEENPIELLLYKFAHCVIPEDTPTGHYTMDFVLWYLRHGSSVMEPISAVSSRVFEVIAKDDAPLDALSEFQFPRSILGCFLAPLLAFWG
jgi:hypothetical protein